MMGQSRTESIAIAKRYATASFALAAQAGVQARVVAEFRALANAALASPELMAALKNPLVSRSKKRAILLGLMGNAHALTSQSLGTLADQGRAQQLPYVADALEAMLTEHEGAVVAEITSARPLNAAMQSQLKDSLVRATGKKVTLKLIEDASVLGGVAIRIGSHLLDATLAGALNAMRTKLLSAG